MYTAYYTLYVTILIITENKTYYIIIILFQRLIIFCYHILFKSLSM